MTETKKPKDQKSIEIAANMQMNGGGLVLRSANELKVTAELFFSGGIIPPALNSMAKVACVVEAGLELGFKPWQAIQNLHIVNGQIGIKSTAIGGLIRSKGKAKYLKQYYEGKEGTDDYCAVVQSQRVEDDTTVHETKFSIADAKTAGLWGKDNWKHYPKDMLMWRALSRHGRVYYGDVLSGFYTVEELQEIHPPQEQATPDAGSRDDRKKVGAKVIDTRDREIEQIIPKLEVCLDEFAKNIFGDKDIAVPGEVLNQAFAKFANFALDDPDTDYSIVDFYTLEKLGTLQRYIETMGIPQDIIDLIPVPVKDDPTMTAEEADAHLEEKLTDFRYRCNKCSEVFDEPGGQGKVPLCPKCLSKDITDIQKYVAKAKE